MSAFADTTWLFESTLSRWVCTPTAPTTVICLDPIFDLLFVKGLEGITLTEVMVIFVTIRTEGFGLCFGDPWIGYWNQSWSDRSFGRAIIRSMKYSN